MRDADQSVAVKACKGNALGTCCPLCEQRLCVGRRGADYFAWCSNGPYNVGCSGISGFGDYPEEALEAAINDFTTL